MLEARLGARTPRMWWALRTFAPLLPDGAELLDVPGAQLPAEDTPAPPRLLPMRDSILLAYADRSRVIRSDYRRLVARSNGDVLPALLVDGTSPGWRCWPTGSPGCRRYARWWTTLPSAEVRVLSTLKR
jgi:hypothetical protein